MFLLILNHHAEVIMLEVNSNLMFKSVLNKLEKRM